MCMCTVAVAVSEMNTYIPELTCKHEETFLSSFSVCVSVGFQCSPFLNAGYRAAALTEESC